MAATLVSRYLRRRIRASLDQFEGLEGYLPDLLARVAGWAVILVGVLLALGILGFETGGAVLVIVLMALVLVLAGRGILENFAAGVVLQARGPFRVTDRIESKGYRGIVREINGRAVVIETADSRTVHIPNADVLADSLVNYTENPDHRSEISVGVAYDADVVEAQRHVVATASSVGGVYSDPKPLAFIEEFGDSSVELTVQFWHEDGKRVLVRGRVAEALKLALDSAEIEIPFPQRVVIVEDHSL